MKKLFLAIVVFIIGLSYSFSQPSQVMPGSPIPPIKILLTNGNYYYSSDIPKNNPFVLIYFAPDCEHCIKLIDQLFKKIHEMEKASIVMVTFKSIGETREFEKAYSTFRYPNITVGTEGNSYILRNYYRIDKTPFTAVYDKKGVLAFSYKNETPVDEMMARLNKL